MIAKTLSLSLLCLIAGSFASLAMAPYHYWYLLFVGLGLLYFCCAEAEKPRSALLYGYLFGFGYFVFGLSWIGNALLVEGNDYAWAWPLAVGGLPLILAPFIALPCWLSRKYFDLKMLKGFTVFVALMSVFEILRGHIFTGFPWNLFGYTWGENLELAQIASLGTIYGLSLLTILWASALGFVAQTYKTPRLYLPILALAVLTFVGTYAFGSMRLNNTPTAYQENVQVRIIQPNIDQAEKWDRLKMPQNFFKMVRMSYPKKTDTKEITTLLIWPETALSYVFLDDTTAMNILKQALGSYPGTVYLITGALRRDTERRYYNSLLVFNKDAEIIQTYNKHHLVPFGEYIPFQDWIPLKPVAQFTGFKTGDSPTPISVSENVSILPLICYEGIFPHLSFGKYPHIIVNLTNDAWYGESFGPHQHLVQTRFRAIESGAPLARAANTGISSIVDPYGRTLLQSGLFEDAILTHNLPLKHNQ